MGNCCGRPARCANASTPFHSEKHQSSKNFSNSSTPRKANNPAAAAPNSTTTSSRKSLGDSASHAVGGLKPFSLSDLKAATKNFRSETLLGEGGFGFVFKGWIDEATHAPTKPGSGIVVAVKKLKRESFQGHKEWLAEVTYLGQLHHENLVKLIGYCMELDHRLLVYEYMQKGSLENHLFKKGAQPISWATRVHIAIGVARGLVFLHNLENQVIFRDLKASNILLDMDYNAKLSDFGLARNGPTGDRTHVSTRVVGTRGYAAPEYVATGHLSVKSDIYSFGVVLLELMSGRRALDEERAGGGGRGVFEETLVDWAKPFLSDKRKLLRIMDTRLEGQYAKRGAQELAAIAEECLDPDPKARPNMVDILPRLEKLQSSRAPTRHGVQARL